MLLWASFLAACVATLFFFAYFDPVLLAHDVAPPAWLADRMTGYAVGFFFFWAVCTIASFLTAYLDRYALVRRGLAMSAVPGASDSLYAARQKIYVREVSGRYDRLRVIAVCALLGLFYGLPWLQWDGHQAMLFDLPARKFHIFGLLFFPQDFFLLTWLLIIAAVSLFFFTALAGRLWCGYACPQTVWTSVFIGIERWFEGNRQQRMKLDHAPWTPHKFLRKGGKQVLWIAFAVFTGLTFVGYFSPIRELVPGHPGRSLGGLGVFLDPVLRLRDLRQRRLHARAGVQVHVPVCALPERDVRPEHIDHLLRRRSAASPAARGRATRSARAGPRRLRRLHAVRPGLPHRHRYPQGPAVRVHCLRRVHRCVRRRHAAPELRARPDPLRDAELDGRHRRRASCARARSSTARCCWRWWSASASRWRSGNRVARCDARPQLAVPPLDDGSIENVYTVRLINKTDRAQRFRIEARGASALTLLPGDARVQRRPAATVYSLPLRVRRAAYEPLGPETITLTVRSVDDPAISSTTDARFLAPAR